MKYIMTVDQIEAFSKYLRREERATGTVAKYLHELGLFYEWLEGREVSKEIAAEWKEHLKSAGRAAVTVNASLAALHSFFAFMGWQECRVKYLKIQRHAFREVSKELTREEYVRLAEAAGSQGNTRLALIMETICSTGIRVSELSYITVEAVKRGVAEVSLKGKIRTVLLPEKLQRKLKKYIR